MNTWALSHQKTLAEKLEKRIHEKESEILALSRVVYNPKKDGTDRSRFEANFALDKLGERYTFRSGESWPWVKFDPRYDKGQTDCIDIEISSVSKEEADKAGLEGGPSEHLDTRYYFPRYAPGTAPVKEGASAKVFIDIIHEKIIPTLKEQLATLKQNLADLPKYMEDAVTFANQFRDFCAKYPGDLGIFAKHDTMKVLDIIADKEENG
jgi:hypothetical protein